MRKKHKGNLLPLASAFQYLKPIPSGCLSQRDAFGMAWPVNFNIIRSSGNHVAKQTLHFREIHKKNESQLQMSQSNAFCIFALYHYSMNIIITCGSASWGGLEMQSLKLALSLIGRGHSILLIVPEKSTLHRKAEEVNVPVVPLKWSDLNTPANIFRLRKIIGNFEPQIIHVQLSHDLWTIVPAMGRKTKAALVHTRRMAASQSKKDFFHKLLYKKLDVLLCISSFIKENAIQHLPVPAEKATIHFNGLNLRHYNPDQYDKLQSRNELGITKDAYVIGFLGRFTHMKGHLQYFEAGKILQQMYPEKKLFFLVAGGDSFGETEFGNGMREKGIQMLGRENVLYTGEVQNTPLVLSAMDVLAFPSHQESFGNVLCEAGAMKISVVASCNGGVPDIVVHDKTGLLVEPLNSTALADGLSQYILQPELAEKHGKNAFLFIREKFDEKKQTTLLEQIYADLVKKKNNNHEGSTQGQ
jgi:glycosyltransferase involved in cell wall biosynthesis